jgi:transposase
MQKGDLLMTQEERDRLCTLKETRKGLKTQREAAEELGVSERHVRRLLGRLREQGDKSVIHGLTGKPSNRRIEEAIRKRTMQILSRKVYRGFGPTLASEYLRQEHDIEVSRETVRNCMIEGRLWRARKERIEKVHLWRPRRSRCGELVQWDTSEHDWLEGRGEKLYLIAMIDDATSGLLARFVRQDSTEENMRLLWSYLERYGRPQSFYTDQASLFETAQKLRRGQQRQTQDAVELPPTQIGRALQELGIEWIPAHSPQAKGRVERNFQTAQDRLVKGLRVARVTTMEQANHYLEQAYLPWWNRTRTVAAGSPHDAHRALDQSHNLAAVLSHVQTRQVRDDYTLKFQGQLYQIERAEIRTGLRGANVRVERRLDSSLAVRFRERYVAVKRCETASQPAAEKKAAAPELSRRRPQRNGDWGRNFDLKKAPKIWQAAASSGYPAAEWRP